MRTAVRALAAVLVAATVLGAPSPAAQTASAAAVAAAPDEGLTLLEEEVVFEDGRLHELTLQSPALGRPARVRVLLPAGYDDPAAAARRYPVLLLLHGTDGDQRSWTGSSDVEGHTAGLDLIVVMPEGGATGFYSDWIDGPAWETHHLEEVLPWVEATYRAVGAREGRAVAGLSMGGFGAMAYAARHPDRFVSAASFSGAVDVADLSIVEAEALEALGVGDDRRWGPYLTHEAQWRGHNPPDLASNLRPLRLRLVTRTGVPCPGDSAPSAVLEAAIAPMNVGFATRLTLAGVAHELVVQPCGTHEWHHWDHDLAAWLPGLMATFAAPPATPGAFDHRATDPVTSVWGWTFTTHRPAIEFLDLRDVSPAGLALTGSGPVDVLTSPAFDPGAAYDLTSASAGVLTLPVGLLPPLVDLPAGSPTSVTAVADAAGRLAFTVDLGPPHTANQYSPEGILAESLALGSYFRRAEISIRQRTAAPEPAPTPTVGREAARTGTLPATGGTSVPWGAVTLALAAAGRCVLHAAAPCEGRRVGGDRPG
ncbi:MAG: alpha/beta hydrolase family protein [Acidimicrobiales bacterium]|nr:alpha/beta hydrolase family protein [Acidimicrobiales bacterium]